MPVVLRDHPSWQPCFAGWSRHWRLGEILQTVVTDSGGFLVSTEKVTAEPMSYHLDRELAESLPPELADSLLSLGTVLRWPNPSLWDALVTAIIRQVIRAPQARLLYQKLCIEHGEGVEALGRIVHLLPGPEILCGLTEDAYAALGLKLKAPALRAAARAYLEHAERWAILKPAELVIELQTVPRIGPWTAGATVADLTGDFSLYPYADLAVRTWANAAAPTTAWPSAETTFAVRWRDLAGTHLSALTVLILTWGDHHVKTPRPVPDQ